MNVNCGSDHGMDFIQAVTLQPHCVGHYDPSQGPTSSSHHDFAVVDENLER